MNIYKLYLQLINRASKTIWGKTTLREIGHWATGYGFPLSQQGHEDKIYLFCKVSDMNLLGNEKYIKKTINSIDETIDNKIELKLHAKGTIIFPKIGGAIATNKRRILTRPTAIDNNCLGINPYESVESEWLYHFLNGIDFSEYQVGTSVPALNQKTLDLIEVPSIPLSEQKLLSTFFNWLETKNDKVNWDSAPQLPKELTEYISVMELIDSIHSKIDSLKKDKNEVQVLLSNLRHSILQEAVQGKLVSQDLKDEPASVLLKNIKAEKERLVNDKRIKQEKPLPEITVDEIPFELPQGWKWVRLSEIGTIYGGGTPSKSNPSFWIGDIPWISPKDMKQKFLSDGIDHISQQAVKESATNLIEKHSLLFVIRGMILVHSFPVAINNVRLCINQDMKALNFFSEEIKDFYYYLFLAERQSILQLVERSSHGTCRLEIAKLQNMLFPLPPLNEQKRIVEKVDQLMALCDELERMVEQSKQESEMLMQSVLQEAFSLTGNEDNVVEFPSVNYTDIEDWEIAARSDGGIIPDTKSKIKNRVTELLGKSTL